LLDVTYEEWSRDTLERINNRLCAKEFNQISGHVDASLKHDEGLAKDLATSFADYLTAARAEGFSDCTPGRFLLPGDLAGSPVLTFAPVPTDGPSKRGSLHREMARRFEAYKDRVVQPFFREHFARIDRQVVLVDALGAIHQGPQAVEDLRRAMSETLTAFRPGQNSFLKGLLGAKRAGAGTAALAIASLRATTEAVMPHEGDELNVVRGTLLDTGKEAAFYPGDLPTDPAHLLNPAREGADKWLDADYQVMRFAPAPLALKPGDGPPHIRLDRAAEFLIGDRL